MTSHQLAFFGALQKVRQLKVPGLRRILPSASWWRYSAGRCNGKARARLDFLRNRNAVLQPSRRSLEDFVHVPAGAPKK